MNVRFWMIALTSGAVAAMLAAGCQGGIPMTEGTATQPGGGQPSVLAPSGGERMTGKVYVAHRAAGAVKIGTEDDPATWASAMVMDDFRVVVTNAPAVKTSAMLLWDDQNLYFLARAQDQDVVATHTKGADSLWDEDVVELWLKAPGGDIFGMEINPLGTVAPQPPEMAKGLTAAGVVWGTANNPADKDRGYRVVASIPWASMPGRSGPPKNGEEWRFLVSRYDYSSDKPKSPQLSASAPLSQDDFKLAAEYFTLKFDK